MTQSTTYPLLKKKYSNFQAPTVKISVDGVEIVEKKHASVSNVSIELTSEYAASGCSFDVSGEYLSAKTNFNSKGVASKLELGAKVQVAIGYIKIETVFIGLITEVSYVFEEESAPYFHVECMDAKCLLMKTQRLELCGETTIKQAVGNLFGEQPVKDYLTGKTISLTGGDKEPISIGMVSDYDFIVRQAQYVGCEFFVLVGKAYFRTQPSVSVPIMTIGPDMGLLSARLSLRGSKLIKSVTVVGVDPEKAEKVEGTASISGKFGKSSLPKKMMGNSKRTYFDSRASSASDAQKRAKILLSGIQNDFGFLEACCIGIPELVPGRILKVIGLADCANAVYYVTGVHHVLDESGFTTSFEARINTL